MKNKKCLSCSCDIVNFGKKYCSVKCQRDYEWRIKKQKVKESGSANLNKIFNSKVAKRYLKETRGIKCEICGITKWLGKEIPLVLDHIDGNSDNWNLENIRLICGNCDMQTDTYKGKNLGRGRYYRKIRYRDGKSY